MMFLADRQTDTRIFVVMNRGELLKCPEPLHVTPLGGRSQKVLVEFTRDAKNLTALKLCGLKGARVAP